MKRLVITVLLTILSGQLDVSASRADHWPVARLPHGGSWYRGEALYRVATALERSSRFSNGYYAIYAAEAVPGADYSFALRYKDELNRTVRVALYDRWPLDPGAKRYDLPMGPVLKRQDKTLHYRWRFSVSPRSPRGNLFILVEAQLKGEATRSPFHHRVRLLSPAPDPKNLMGRGVTYLHGPEDLVLASGGQEHLSEYVLLLPVYEDGRPVAPPLNEVPIPGDLVRNGDFRSGFLHWKSIDGSDREVAGFSIGPNGLRLHSDQPMLRSGISQELYADVRGARSLWLDIDLRILAEADKRTACGVDTPVFVTICYEDEQEQVHCAENSFRYFWTTVADIRPCANHQLLKPGEWEHFSKDLMRLSPPPKLIRALTIAGGGPPGRDAEVREVHLVREGDEKWRARP
ncbi:MAG: hypothetical protein D6790_18895 [Caldilineae bacterium]|nr:MAG: hypothetical protein D6790_18895 [Caldilineae bacterium]